MLPAIGVRQIDRSSVLSSPQYTNPRHLRGSWVETLLANDLAVVRDEQRAIPTRTVIVQT